jgi:hypothetical protein
MKMKRLMWGTAGIGLLFGLALWLPSFGKGLLDQGKRAMTQARLDTITQLAPEPGEPSTPAAQPAAAAEGMTRFDSRSGSKVRVEGTSTAHDWQLESRLIQGYLEVGPKFPMEAGQAATPGEMDAHAEVLIRVSALKSVKRDGSYYDDKMDEKVYENLKEPTSKNIVFHLNELTLKESAKTQDDSYVFEAKGDLVVAGVTNSISMPVNIKPMPGKKLKITGSVPLKMTSFKIPIEKFIIFSVGDDVKVIFDWTVGQKTASPAAK